MRTFSVLVMATLLSIPAFAAPLPPYISGISPTVGPTAGGFPLTISGKYFGTTPAAVSVGGANCSSMSWADDKIICMLPAGEGLNKPVTVTNGGGTSNTVVFNYDKPFISGISPSGGSTAGGSEITLIGSNFGLTGSVTVGGQVCPKIAQTHTTVKCTLPAGQGLNQQVVFTGAASQTAKAPFNYLAPSITAITPATGSTAGGIVLDISGSNFGTSGATVMIGGNNCGVVAQTHTLVKCTLPSGQGLNQPVMLSVGGQSAPTRMFSYNAPSISGVVPNSGPTAGGVEIAINGSNFGTSPAVSIGGVNCPTVAGATHTMVKCTLPAGQGVAQPVVVSAAGQMSAPQSFTYNTPSISNLSPTFAPSAGGIEIALTGSNFGTSAAVTIGGSPCSTTTQTHSSIKCVVPAGSGSNKSVVVTVAGQQATSPILFSYASAPPSIANVSPASGPTAGGIDITINGSNFGSSPSVPIGGNLCALTSNTETVIHCQLPAGEGTSKKVVVVRGSDVSNVALFSYDPPSVSAVQPSSGPSGGGIDIMVYGSNFGLAPQVTIGGQPCNPVGPQSHTAARCKLPAGQGSNQSIAVTAAGQMSASSPAVVFSYDASPPAIANISPASVPTAGGVELSIYGSNFGTSPSVTVAGVNCPVTTPSDSLVKCLAPAGEGLNRAVVVTSAGRTSAPAYLNYAAPDISSITPSPGPTSGGIEITINGSNFGTAASATIAGQPCLSSAPQTHTSFKCTLPVGQGLNQFAVVMVGGQSSTPKVFNYAAPTISVVDPTFGPAAGGTTVRIAGSNFGTNAVVTIGGVLCAPSAPQLHTSITCTAPGGTPGSAVLTVNVAGQSATNTFTYQ